MATPKTAPLKVVYVPIDDPIPADYNPRIFPPAMAEKLKKSFKQHGFALPIIVNSAPNRKNIIINGHFRLMVAKELGYTEVPVTYLDIPDIEEEKSLNLRLNKIEGEWDFEKLQDFDISMLLDVGFDDIDLSNVWDKYLDVEDDNFDVEKELEKNKTPTTKPGDLFQLGPHRLICGDATDKAVVKKLVANDKIHMFYTDPPFNIKLDYNGGISGKKKYGGKQTKDNKKDEDYRAFLKKLILNTLLVAHPDLHFFMYCDQKYIGLSQDLCAEVGLDFKRVCLWIKNAANPTPQWAFNKCYEACVYSTKGKPYLAPGLHHFDEIMNKEMGSGNRLIEDVLDYLDIWLVKKLPTVKYDHPAEKPPTLHEKALRRCTKPGDIVMDLTAGSGSLLVSCHQLKRKAYLCELEPIFCDLILSRYQQLTHEQAKKLN